MRIKVSLMQGIISALLLLMIGSVYAASNSPMGNWKTVDDQTGQNLGIIQIYSSGNTLEGKIIKITPILGHKSTDRCVKCKGAFYNKPILGMRVIWGMHQISANSWSGGQMLEPRNGNIYRGSIKLVDGTLKVSGHVGPFSRTQTWIRANS